MTQLEQARAGTVTDALVPVAKEEQQSPEALREKVAAGRVVVPINHNRSVAKLCGIGEGLRTKVNANIGTSMDQADEALEVCKLRTAEQAGADTVMDLSTGGDITRVRERILAEARVPVGTVPIYEAAALALKASGSLRGLTSALLLETFEAHAKSGVDFATLHCGVTMSIVKRLKASRRTCGMVSRGGTILAEWMLAHGVENPFFERFDEVIAIAREHDVTLSLGDGLRPGSVVDALDQSQVEELIVLADLAQRAFEAGVQVMIEGPGHVPLHQIEAQVRMQKELCKGAPFYVLGPLVTDVAPGYDHIVAAIGGAVAAAAGADFLCYVTPSEHLSLPGPQHVREGVMAARIAAHAADIAKGVKGAIEWDRSLSEKRRCRDWEGQLAACLDPDAASKFREQAPPQNDKVCSMCGEYCVFKLADEGLR